MFRMILKIFCRKKTHFVLGKLENGMLVKANFENSDSNFLRAPRLSASALNGNMKREIIFPIKGIYILGKKNDIGRIYYQKEQGNENVVQELQILIRVTNFDKLYYIYICVYYPLYIIQFILQFNLLN